MEKDRIIVHEPLNQCENCGKWFPPEELAPYNGWNSDYDAICEECGYTLAMEE